MSRAGTRVVLARRRISEQWHSDQAGNEFGGWTTNVEGDWLLNSGSESLSTENTWCGSSESFLSFEHWVGGIGQQGDYIDGTTYGSVNFPDVFNSDPQTGISTAQQIRHSPTEDVDLSFSLEPFDPKVPLDLEFVGIQANADLVSGESCLLDPTLQDKGELDSVDPFHTLLLSQDSYPTVRIAEEFQPESNHALDTPLDEQLRSLSSDGSSRESSDGAQHWPCDFPKCSRICTSRQKLRYTFLFFIRGGRLTFRAQAA